MRKQSETSNFKNTQTLLEALADAYDQLDLAKDELNEFTYKHCHLQLTGMIEELLIIAKHENWAQKKRSN